MGTFLSIPNLASITRDTYNESKNYRKLIFQKGLPVLDAELNELQQTMIKQLQLFIKTYGDFFIESAFQIEESSSPANNIKIKAGWGAIKGVFSNNSIDLEYSAQAVTQDFLRMFFWNSDISVPVLTTPGADRNDLVVATFVLRDFNGALDPTIIDPNLAIETAIRKKVEIGITVLEGYADIVNFESQFTYENEDNVFRVPIAILHRLSGEEGILTAMIEDVRPMNIGINETIKDKIIKISGKVVNDADNTSGSLWTASRIIQYVADFLGISESPRNFIDFWDASTGLPVSPSDGDTYICDTAGNGWVENGIYLWFAVTSEWKFYSATNGKLIKNLTDELTYQFTGTVWVIFQDILNVDKVDGKDVNDTLIDDTALWTAAKIINFVTTYVSNIPADTVAVITDAFVVLEKTSDDVQLALEDVDDKMFQINTAIQEENEDLRNRLYNAELKNIEQVLEDSIRRNGNPKKDKMILDTMVNVDKMRDVNYEKNEVNEVSRKFRHEWGLNWKKVADKGYHKQGFICNRKQKYKLEIIDEYVLTGIGQKYKGDISRWDSVNKCYWMVTTAGNNNVISELLKLSDDLSEGKVIILARWYLKENSGYAADQYVSIDVSPYGDFLLIGMSHNATGSTYNGVCKFNINSDGTLGYLHKKANDVLNWISGTWGTSFDANAIQEWLASTGTYYKGLTIWDDTHFAVLNTSLDTGSFYISAITFICLASTSGSFDASPARGQITNVESVLLTNNSFSSEYFGSTSIKKFGNELWIKRISLNTGTAPNNHKNIYCVDVSDDGSNYTGDIYGALVSGAVMTRCSKGVFDVSEKNYIDASSSDYNANPGITKGKDGHILEVVNYMDGDGAYLVKRAYVGAYDIEGGIQGIRSLIYNTFATTGYISGVEPNLPNGVYVEYEGNEKYYWIADYAVSANQVDVFRINARTMELKHCRLTTGSWVSIAGFCIIGTDLYILGLTGSYSQLYKGSLATFKAGMQLSYAIGNAFDLVTWGTLSTGIGATYSPKLYGIAHDTDANVLLLLNDTNDKIGSLSIDGATYNDTVYLLPAAVNQWMGLAYKNGKLFTTNYTNNTDPDYIYVLNKALSSSTTYFIEHMYFAITYPFNTYGNSGVGFDGNDMVCYNRYLKQVYIIKNLEDPTVMQVNIFMNNLNILRQNWVSCHSPIIERSTSSEEFYEDLGNGFVRSKRNMPDRFYILVGYGQIASATQTGFDLLNLDIFLNDSVKTSAGMIRYDLSKIRIQKFETGNQSKMIMDNDSSYGLHCNNIIAEREMILANFSSTWGNATSYTYLIDLKTGRACYLGGYETGTIMLAGNMFNGLLSDRNNVSKTYAGCGLSNPQIKLPNVVFHRIAAKTFLKGDSSNYQGSNPITVFAIPLEGSGVCLLIVDWDTQHTPRKVYLDIFGTGATTSYNCFISDQGFLIIQYNDMQLRFYKSNSKVWEINEDSEWYSITSNNAKTGSREFMLENEVSPMDAVKPNVGFFGDGSCTLITPEGTEKNYILLGTQDSDPTGPDSLAIVLCTVEDEICELVFNDDAASVSAKYGFTALAMYEDYIFGLLIDYNTGKFEKFLWLQKNTVDDKRLGSIATAVKSTKGNWNIVREVGYDTKIFFSPAINNVSQTAGMYYSHRINFSDKFGIVSMDSKNWGITLWSVFRYMQDSVYESIDYDVDEDARSCIIKKEVSGFEGERIIRLNPSNSNVDYTENWLYVATLQEVLLEALANAIYNSGKFGIAKELLKTTGDKFIKNTDFVYGQRIDSGTYDIYDDSDSGAFTAGKHMRVVVDGENVTGTLALQVYAQEMAAGIVVPAKDKCYIDPLNAKLCLPQPIYWCKCESFDNYNSKPDIGGVTNVYGGLSGVGIPGSGYSKFGNSVYLYTSGGTVNARRISNSRLRKGAIEFWMFSSGHYSQGRRSVFTIQIGSSLSVILGYEYQNSRGIYIDGVFISGSGIDATIGLHHYYFIWDKDKGIAGGTKTASLFVDGIEMASTGNALNSVDNIDMELHMYTYNYGMISVDNIKVWQDIPSESADWVYNSGTGRENALHYIYGAGNSYKPSTIQVGYNYLLDSSTPTELTEAANSGDSAVFHIPFIKRAGIRFERNTNRGIGLISIKNITDNIDILVQDPVDFYLSFKEDFIYWMDLDETKEYEVTVEHSGGHNTSAVSPYSILIEDFIFGDKLSDGEVGVELVFWHSDHNEEKSFIDVGDKLEITAETGFTGDGTTKEFSLLSTSRAIRLHSVSPDGGVTWLNERDYRLRWGSNSPTFDNRISDTNGYFTIVFDDAPINNAEILVKYYIKKNKCRVRNILKMPTKDGFVDNRKKVDMLAYGVSFI